MGIGGLAGIPGKHTDGQATRLGGTLAGGGHDPAEATADEHRATVRDLGTDFCRETHGGGIRIIAADDGDDLFL